MKLFRGPLQVALFGQDQAQVETAGGGTGVDADNCFKLLPGRFHEALEAQHDAQIVVRVQVVRIRLQRETVLGDGASGS